MNVVIRLLIALGKAGTGIGNFITSLSVAAWLHSVDIDTITRSYRGTPEVQKQIEEQLPPLTPQEEALLVEFRKSMDLQYQIEALKRYVLTLPALPDEGY